MWEVVKSSKTTFKKKIVGVWWHLGGPTHKHYHFQSNKRGHTTPTYPYSFGPHPFLIQRSKGGGGHTTHAYSFSYGATPTSSPKGGGGGGGDMCLKCPAPRSTYALERVWRNPLHFCVSEECGYVSKILMS